MNIKKLLAAIALTLSVAYASTFGGRVIIAQSLPYSLNVAWDASPDAATYNCYLDGVFVVSSATLTCTMPVNTLGPHTVGVSALNNAFVPGESAQATLAFKLQQPGKPSNIKVK